MITILNEDGIFVFDEFGWGDKMFHGHDVAKDLITNQIDQVVRVEFYSGEKVIVIHTEAKKMGTDYWFRDIDADLLNFLCQIPKFRNSVRRFFMRGGYSSFSVEKYPLLAAVLLGNNNEY